MGATASAGSVQEAKQYEVLEAGVYVGRCLQVVELGTHQKTWKEETKEVEEIMIVWELNALMEDGRPFTVNWRGTKSLGQKASLFKLLTNWRGTPFTDDELKCFQFKNILNAPCMLNITKSEGKNGRIYNNVLSVMPLPKGMQAEELKNEKVDFGITDLGTPEFEKVWPWVRKIIAESNEGKRFFGPKGYDPMADKKEDVPKTQLHKPDDMIPF